jgi:predicted alpha/beta hydrolase
VFAEMTECFSIETDDGWLLNVLHIPAAGDVRGAILVGHAMMVDRRSLDRPAGLGMLSFLASRGWHVYAPDLRGRGASGPTVSEGGEWSYDALVRFDLPACLAAVRVRSPDVPVAVLGHSLCGHVSIAAAGTGCYARQPDAHVLLSANTWAPSLEDSLWMRLRKGAACLLLALLSRLFGRFPARLFRVGPVDESGTYISDLVRFWREDCWVSADGSLDYMNAMSAVKGPVLALIGQGDKLLAHPAGAQRWSERIGAGDVDFRILSRGDLGLEFDPDHMELATDLRSRPIWKEIDRWLSDRLAAP